MQPTLTIGDANIYLGNNLDVLPELPDNSVDSIVCDPPYELGFMGKTWDASGIAYSVQLWTECLRVLKPGGHLLAFGGSRTWHRLAVAIEDAGFEMRDSIAWLYGSGFPKSHNISKAIDKLAGAEREVIGYKESAGYPDGAVAVYKNRQASEGSQVATSGMPEITAPATDAAKQWDGWGTALKPAFEPIVVARKPLLEKTVAENVLTYGTGGLNIDASRIGTETIINQPGGIPNGANNFVGTNKQRDRTITPTISEGRWPANIILDETTAQLLDEQSGQVKGAVGMKKHTNFTFDVGEHQGQTFTQGKSDIGGASRFFYVAKANKRDRNEGLDELPEVSASVGDTRPSGDFNQRLGTNDKPAQPRQNFHPTVKPTSLMTYLIKLVTPPNGVVLDPFAGSGSTGKAALLNGYKFIGIELTEEYLPIIEGRLEHIYKTITDE